MSLNPSAPLTSLATLARSLRSPSEYAKFDPKSIATLALRIYKFNQKSIQNCTKNRSKIETKSTKNHPKIGPKSVSEGSWLLSSIFHRFLSPPGRLLGASWRVLGASWTRLGRLLGAKLEPKSRPKPSKNRVKNDMLFDHPFGIQIFRFLLSFLSFLERKSSKNRSKI